MRMTSFKKICYLYCFCAKRLEFRVVIIVDYEFCIILICSTDELIKFFFFSCHNISMPREIGSILSYLIYSISKIAFS